MKKQNLLTTVLLLCALVAGSGNAWAIGIYEKVTSAPTDWSGVYLIVYETGNVAMDGSLATIDVTSNTVDVEISDGVIVGSADIDAATFTIAKHNTKYYIKAANGKYIGNTSNSNGLTASDTGLDNTITLDEGNVNIVSSGGAYLRYNSSSGQERFRYFKSSTYTSQKAIQLYKLTKERVTVGTKGYATYCSNPSSALDFTGKSIAAYTIACTDGSSLTLTQKNKVAKNEPVLLYSSTNDDSQDIPVIADGEASVDGTNKLVQGDNAAHNWVEGTAEHYVLVTDDPYEPGFYRANNNTVASTKAFLDLTGLAPAHSFTLDLGEGDVTGIANVNVEKDTMNGAFYNLAGQRVAQPTKGLYIVNGKKVVLK